MDKPRLAWAITGSGHYIEDCVEFLLSLDNVDVYISRAGEEVFKMYGLKLDDLRNKMPVYRDKAASAPPVGNFYKGIYHTLVVAPTTSNTVAKCVLGISDSLVTNIYAQAGKCRVPSIVFACDVAPEMLTTAPGGEVMVYPRKIDLHSTDTLRGFEYTDVVDNVEQLISKVKQRIAHVQDKHD